MRVNEDETRKKARKSERMIEKKLGRIWEDTKKMLEHEKF